MALDDGYQGPGNVGSKPSSLKKAQILQDLFLNTLRRERVQVSIYLVNGIKLQGPVESFDQYVILLGPQQKGGATQMVYKHGIATIVPGRPIDLGKLFSENGQGGD